MSVAETSIASVAGVTCPCAPISDHPLRHCPRSEAAAWQQRVGVDGERDHGGLAGVPRGQRQREATKPAPSDREWIPRDGLAGRKRQAPRRPVVIAPAKSSPQACPWPSGRRRRATFGYCHRRRTPFDIHGTDATAAIALRRFRRQPTAHRRRGCRRDGISAPTCSMSSCRRRASSSTWRRCEASSWVRRSARLLHEPHGADTDADERQRERDQRRERRPRHSLPSFAVWYSSGDRPPCAVITARGMRMVCSR